MKNENDMVKRTLLALTAFSFLVFLSGQALAEWGPTGFKWASVAAIGLFSGYVMGLYLLVSNGSISKTVFLPILLACIAVALVGVGFKVMHWPYANEALLVGLLGTVITYLIRFFTKREKGLLDFMKAAWVVSAALVAALILLRHIGAGFYFIPHSLFALTLVVFVASGAKQRD